MRVQTTMLMRFRVWKGRGRLCVVASAARLAATAALVAISFSVVVGWDAQKAFTMRWFVMGGGRCMVVLLDFFICIFMQCNVTVRGCTPCAPQGRNAHVTAPGGNCWGVAKMSKIRIFSPA